MADAVSTRIEHMARAAPSPALARVIERFVRAFAPKAIVLFGSYAKGTQHSGSDVDLLVIAEFSGSSTFHLRRAHQLAMDCFPPVDVVFATPAEVADSADAPSPFLRSILERSQLVYAEISAGI
jgi:predicted nucleotidyltransferase